jgi:hypothetical protein
MAIFFFLGSLVKTAPGTVVNRLKEWRLISAGSIWTSAVVSSCRSWSLASVMAKAPGLLLMLLLMLLLLLLLLLLELGGGALCSDRVLVVLVVVVLLLSTIRYSRHSMGKSVR